MGDSSCHGSGAWCIPIVVVILVAVFAVIASVIHLSWSLHGVEPASSFLSSHCSALAHSSSCRAVPAAVAVALAGSYLQPDKQQVCFHSEAGINRSRSTVNHCSMS